MSSLKGVKPGDTIATIQGGGVYKPILSLWHVDSVGSRTVRCAGGKSWYIGTGESANVGGGREAHIYTPEVQERFDRMMAEWDSRCAFDKLLTRRCQARRVCNAAIDDLLSGADSIDAVERIVEAVSKIGGAA